MAIKRFEDSIAWQKAQELAAEIYLVFGELKDRSFKSQICRAAVSISNNIAEGFDRDSDRDFNRYLVIAKGSCNEVKSMLYLAEKLSHLNAERANVLREKADEVGKIIYGLKKSLNVKQ